VSTAPDPVAVHVGELERALHGPARARRSMLAEVRHGLEDAVDAYRADGLDPHGAATAAVRDFGAVPEIVPLMQEELAARQARWTSALVAVAFPAMLLAWDLLWSTGTAGFEGPPTPAVAALSRLVDAQSVLIGAVAAALLLTTFRRTASGRLVPALVGATGVLGAVGIAGTSVVMHLAADGARYHATDTPGPVLAYALSVAVLLAVLRSCVRTLRVVTTPTRQLRATRP
jgi:hypothetical protein